MDIETENAMAFLKALRSWLTKPTKPATNSSAKAPRLTNAEFTMLRSLAKDPWANEGALLWRLKWRNRNTWGLVDKDGFFWPEGSTWGYSRYGLRKKALAAVLHLEALGLAHTNNKRCCPGTDCHLNDKQVFEITEQGLALLEKANAAPRS